MPTLEDQHGHRIAFRESLHIGEVAGALNRHLQRHLRKFLCENVSGNPEQ